MVAVTQHSADNPAEQAVVASRPGHASAKRLVGVALEQAIEDARKVAEKVKHQNKP